MPGPIQRLSRQSLPTALTPTTSLTRSARNEIQVKETITSLEDIQSVITELLSKCRITFYREPYDQVFHDLCLQECVLKGYPIDDALGQDSLLKYISLGVLMATTAYSHLSSQPARMFIAIHTAYILWMDDRYSEDISGLDTFQERFVTGRKQASPTLDALGGLWRDIGRHWTGTQACIILTSNLNFVTGLVMEFETKRMTVLPHARSYVTFQRTMSGNGEAYAMYAFPPEVPMPTYIQAILELADFINYGNDVLSFYKEEKAGETGNYVSNEANQKGVPKLKVLTDLANQVSLCVSRSATVVEGHQAAKDALHSFLKGYVAFHTSHPRYQLGDLFPGPSAIGQRITKN